MTTYKLFIYYLKHVFRQSSSLSWTTPGLFLGYFMRYGTIYQLNKVKSPFSLKKFPAVPVLRVNRFIIN